MGRLLVFIALCLAPAAFAEDAYLRDQLDDWPRRTTIPGVVFGSKIAIDEQPCCGRATGAPAAELPDSDAIARVPDRASRDGKALKLRLFGNRTLRITDCDRPSGCADEQVRLHRLADWWPEQHYYVVEVFGYEEHSAFLIRETDGLVVALAATPVLAPNGSYALAWNFSLMNGPTMQLLDLRLEPPKLREITPTIACQGREAIHPGPKPVWLGDTTIAFDGSTSFSDFSARFRMTLELARNGTLRWECQ